MKNQSFGDQLAAELDRELTATELIEVLKYEHEPADPTEADDGLPPHDWRDAFPTLRSSIESDRQLWYARLSIDNTTPRVTALEEICWELTEPLCTGQDEQLIAPGRVNTLPLEDLPCYVTALHNLFAEHQLELPRLHKAMIVAIYFECECIRADVAHVRALGQAFDFTDADWEIVGDLVLEYCLVDDRGDWTYSSAKHERLRALIPTDVMSLPHFKAAAVAAFCVDTLGELPPL